MGARPAPGRGGGRGGGGGPAPLLISGLEWDVPDPAGVEQLRAQARAALGEAAAAAAWAEGQAMSLEQAVAEALADVPNAA